MTGLAAPDGLPEDVPEEPTREWLESNRAPLPLRPDVVEEDEEDVLAPPFTPPQARTLAELGVTVNDEVLGGDGKVAPEEAPEADPAA